MHLHKKTHAAGPHLSEAAHPETGKLDAAKLAAGEEAWKAAIARGEYELVSGVEFGVDEKIDILVLARRKLK